MGEVLNESQIQAQIVEWLEWNNWVVIETSQRGHDWGTKGSPDVIATHAKGAWQKGNNNGSTWPPVPRTIFIECKGPRGKQSDAQIEMQLLLTSVGAEYILADSLDVVIEYLN